MGTCPNCRSENVRPVIYSADESWREGLAAWHGGEADSCPMDLVSPNWNCEDCGHAWPDQERLAAYREIRGWRDSTGVPHGARHDPAV